MCFTETRRLENADLENRETCKEKVRADLTDYLGREMEAKHLSQKKLANLSNIAQPYISKIMNGKGDPSFSTIMWLICSIEKEGRKKEHENYCEMHMVKVKDILWAVEDQMVSEVLNDMLRKGISQVPVYEKGARSRDGVVRLSNVVGMMTETDILRAGREIRTTKVSDIITTKKMETVTLDKSKEYLVKMLLEEPAALVVAGNSIKGIITKSDLLSTHSTLA